MKKATLILGLLLCCLSCSDDNDNTLEPSRDDVNLKIFNEHVVFSENEGESINLMFEASHDWTLANNTNSWLECDKVSGTAGVNSILLTSTRENLYYEDRSILLVFSVKGKGFPFTISQKKKDAILLDRDKIVVSKAGGDIGINIKTNIEYNVAISENSSHWIKRNNIPYSTKGLKNKIETFVISEAGTEPREGEIVFSANGIREAINVYQAEKDQLVLTTKSLSINGEGGELVIALKTNIEYIVEIQEVDRIWISHIDRSTSRALQVDNIILNIEKNLTKNDRSSRIIIKDINNNLKEEVTVTQFGTEIEETDENIKAIETLVQSVDNFMEGVEKPLTSKVIAENTYESSELIENMIYNTDWKCKTEEFSASVNPDKFMMYNPHASVLWPGNLVQGKSIQSGIPTSIPIDKRKEGAITLAIIGGGQATYSKTVPMKLSTVTQAMNDILVSYSGGTPAMYHFNMENIYSKSQLRNSLSAGFSANLLSSSTAFDSKFNINWNKENTRILVSLSQQFFTMAYDDPAGVEGVFTNDIQKKDLINYVGPGNPLCYISSVTYGRLYSLLYETTRTEKELRAAINFKFKGIVTKGYVQTGHDADNIFASTKVYLTQIGGDPENGLSNAMIFDIDKMKHFLEKGANFNKNNIGEPISYTIKYLKDASLVRMNNTLEYTVNQCESIKIDSVYSKSKFALHFDNMLVSEEVSDGWSSHQCEYQVNIKIIESDKEMNKENTIWQYPESGQMYDFKDQRGNNKEVKLNWSVPYFEIENNPNKSFSILFSRKNYTKRKKRKWSGENEYKSLWIETSDRMYLDFDKSTNTWEIRDPSKASYGIFTQIGSGNSFTIKSFYQFTIWKDDKVMQ